METDVMAKQFGQVLRRRRLSLGLSQEELADHCGIHRTYVGSVERGEKMVTLLTAHKLAHGVGVTLSDLVIELEALLNDDH